MAQFEEERPNVSYGLGGELDPVMTPARRIAKEHEKGKLKALAERGSQPVDYWCACENCVDTGAAIENICCHDDEYVEPWLNEMEAGCITLHPGFVTVVLDKYVLRMVRNDLFKYVTDKNRLERLKSQDNSTYRFLAYRNFRSWINDGKKLGKNNRIVIPACVVNKVREMWPEPSKIYTGFRPSDYLDEIE